MEDAGMRTNNGTMKQLAKLGLLLMMGVSMVGCSNKMEWKEEVKLHDGQVIVAERFYNLGGYPGLESHNRMALDETVTFKLPNNISIVWKTDFRHSTPEPSSLNHFRFDIVNGVPYLATYPAGCISYNKWSRPNPPQILFKYENDQWKRITLAELPSELIGTSANVIVGSPDERILKSFYTVEGVIAENRYINTPEYKTILREPSPKGSDSVVNCLELVPYKGKWIMPNDSALKASIDRESK
jgi:hypothetical protein